MLHQTAPPGYYAPHRTASEVVLYLSPTQPAPTFVPFELQGYISTDVWSVRIPTITRVASRYSRPLFERIWAIIGFIVTLVLPLALYRLIAAQMSYHSDHRTLRHFEARAVGFSIFIALCLFFVLPIAVWKYVGHRKVNTMLRRWSQADRMAAGQNATIPTWKVKTPGVLRDRIVLTISLPLDKPPTSFHPDAYLPSYINGPTDPDAAYYYPYNKGEPGLPRMSVIGNVPLYTDEKRGFGDDKV